MTFTANTGPARNATIEIAGQPILLTQAAPGLSFYVASPCRVLDTRNPVGPLGGPALPPGATRTVDVAASPCGVPPGAKSISVNLTVTQPAAGGYLTVYPADRSLPSTSNVNFAAGRTRANSAVLGLATDGSGAIKVFNGSGGTVHVILDVNGYLQ